MGGGGLLLYIMYNCVDKEWIVSFHIALFLQINLTSLVIHLISCIGYSNIYKHAHILYVVIIRTNTLLSCMVTIIRTYTPLSFYVDHNSYEHTLILYVDHNSYEHTLILFVGHNSYEHTLILYVDHNSYIVCRS